MTGSKPSSHPLVSQLLADDPDLRDIVVEFVDGLSTRIAELNSAHEKLDWERLKTLAHQLKGAGGSYGYPDITTLGAQMETAFRQSEHQQFASWIAQLSALTSAARAGLNLR